MAKPKPKVFLSHIHAEEGLAKVVQKDLLDAHLLGAVDVFVSSDPTANPGGTSWLNNIEDNLRAAEVLLILASPSSIERPWINVEAGAGWVRYLQARAAGTEPVSVMPLCHSGLTPGQLPLPWSTFNSVELRTQGGLQAVLDTCARAAGIRSPTPSLASLVAAVQTLELHYTKYRDIERRVLSVVQALGISVEFFKKAPAPGQFWATGDVRQSAYLIADPDLAWLQNEGHIVYQQGVTSFTGAGTFVNGGISPTPNFLASVLPNLKL